MKTPRFPHLGTTLPLLFLIVLTSLFVNFTAAGKEHQPKQEVSEPIFGGKSLTKAEFYEAIILKVYTAKSKKGTIYIGYVVNWNGSKVVVPEMFERKAKNVGDKIEFMVSEIDMPRYTEDGSFKKIKTLQFMVTPPA